MKHEITTPRWHWWMLLGVTDYVKCSCGWRCAGSRDGCAEGQTKHLLGVLL